MLVEYLQTSLRHAHYEILEEDKSFYGEIPGFRGVYANAPTLEECHEQLKEVLEEWVLFRIYKNLPLPQMDGIEIKNKESCIMPKFGQIKRRDLIAYLNNAGFEGPYSEGKHQFMIRDSVALRVPNLHRGDISKDLLSGVVLNV